MTNDSNSRSRGMSLLELVMTTAVIGTVFVAFVAVEQVTVVEGAKRSVADERWIQGSVVVDEMENAVRLAERVLKAGDGTLLVSTRYFWDLDDGVEEIYYYSSGSSIYRRVADEVATFGSPELIYEHAVSFCAHALEIADSFNAEDYGATAVKTADGASTVDTANKAEYKVNEMGGADQDVYTYYDESNQMLKLEPTTLEPVTVTVTPDLRKKWLHAQTRFRPQVDHQEYRPLVYGSEVPDTTNVSVVFGADGSIRLRSVEGGVLTAEEVSTISWKSGAEYRVQLESEKRYIMATLLNENGRQHKIGAVSSGAIDNAKLHFQSVTHGAVGEWDDLLVDYPLVEIEFEVDLGDSQAIIYGGATRRQP